MPKVKKESKTSSSSRESSDGSQPWQQHHTDVLTRAIIAHLLSSRTTFYRLPELADVNGHGGNRISMKVIQACKRFAKEMDMDASVVDEEIKAGKGRARAEKDSCDI